MSPSLCHISHQPNEHIQAAPPKLLATQKAPRVSSSRVMLGTDTGRVEHEGSIFSSTSPLKVGNNYTPSALHSGIFLGDVTERVDSSLESDESNSFWNAKSRTSPRGLDNNVVAATGYSFECDYTSPKATPKWWNGNLPSFSLGLKIPTSPLIQTQSTDGADLEPVSPRSRALSIVPSPRSWRSTQSSATSVTAKLSPPVAIAAFRTTHNSVYNRGRDEIEGVSDANVGRYMRRRSSGTNGFSSELPLGSFVGSYEESILNGRMSTTPSKPFMFIASIGVLGLGKCKPALRCPPHITLPFSAYFYSVSDYDSPSPYVGQIDLETLNELRDKKFPQGGYRIPQQGQIQLVIKNPNKTAVKLFLVPYDLRDMRPGTKTFVRQKCFATAELSEDNIKSHEAFAKLSLRYLAHLHICCPSKGRYYLYRNIRVVFANRVPDGKEKLRNETMIPEPKYSAWKPSYGRRRSSLSNHIQNPVTRHESNGS